MVDDRVTWRFENAGVAIFLDPTMPKDYVKAAGASGLGVAPTTVQIDPSVNGGGVWRSTLRGSRQIVMPVITFGNDRQEIEDKLRALVRLMNDSLSTPKLVGTYPNGDEFETEVHYSGGADHQWGGGDTDGRYYCRWILQLTAPDPYFTSRVPHQYTVKAAGGRGLLRDTNSMSKLRVSSAQAFGVINVDNPGDVEAWPTWRVLGPGTGFTLTRNGDGAQFGYTGTLSTTGSLVIDTRQKTILSATGTNLYGSLLGAPKFFSLAPGISTLTINVIGSDVASRVDLAFLERRELIF